MGAQQTKDRVISTGSTVRQTRKQTRNLKDSRIIGSNIFTEHSGKNYFISAVLWHKNKKLLLRVSQNFLSNKSKDSHIE